MRTLLAQQFEVLMDQAPWLPRFVHVRRVVSCGVLVMTEVELTGSRRTQQPAVYSRLKRVCIHDRCWVLCVDVLPRREPTDLGQMCDVQKQSTGRYCTLLQVKRFHICQLL